jgi:hypothetical protein
VTCQSVILQFLWKHLQSMHQQQITWMPLIRVLCYIPVNPSLSFLLSPSLSNCLHMEICGLSCLYFVSSCNIHNRTMPSSGVLHHVALLGTDISEERIAYIIRVTRICELETLAVISYWSMLQRNTMWEGKC